MIDRSRLPWGRSAALALIVLLTIGGATSCGVAASGDDGVVMDVEADSALIRGQAALVLVAPDGRPYQFRAVCHEPSHPGKGLVMSKWVEDPKIAMDLGNYHSEWKAKGHHWVLERRRKP